MEQSTKLWIIVSIATIPFIAWRISLFYRLFITQDEFLFEDYDAQILFGLWTILIFTAFHLRSRLEHEQRTR